MMTPAAAVPMSGVPRAIDSQDERQPSGADEYAGQRMLVVDDEEAILFAMEEYFGTHGYRVDCARELEEAEALLAHTRYGVVIADLRLTGINGSEGLELLSFVRACAPRTKILLLTAYGSPAVEAEARHRGVHAFLSKPKPLAEIAQMVMAFQETTR